MIQQFNVGLYENWDMGWAWNISYPEGKFPLVTNAIAAKHEIPDSIEEWQQVFDSTASPSELLWAVSLNYMVDLHKYRPDYAFQALQTFYDAFWGSRDEIAATLGSSWDHCSSLRLKSLTALTGAGDLRIENLAHRCLTEELGKEDYWQMITPNNHGLMLLDSLIGVNLVETLSSGALDRAAVELQRILASVFDGDGFCNENSPAYQHLYVRLTKGLITKYRDRAGCESIVEVAQIYLAMMTETMSQMVKQNGEIPPLGDSNPSKSNYQSVDGTFFSERVGLWIYKHADLYLSFICGFESLTHKHADDTSVTLRYRGEDLITDAGTASYNYRDPRILGLRTQKGHSGIYFTRFDDYHPAKLYGKGIEARSAMVAATETTVRGGYMISGHYVAHRHVMVQSSTRIQVEDHTSSLTKAQTVTRFIIPPEIEILLESQGFWLFGAKVAAHVSFSERVKSTIFHGQQEPPHKGWISLRANETTPARCVEVSRSLFGTGKLVHTIELMERPGDSELKRLRETSSRVPSAGFVRNRIGRLKRMVYGALLNRGDYGNPRLPK